MKTIFNQAARAELMTRISALTDRHTAQWGKMNLYQMIRHCTQWNDWVLGKTKTPARQEFIGKIFGRMALKGMIKNDSPMKKGMPAGRHFTIREQAGDVAFEQQRWLEQIAEYAHFSNHGFIHDFFGKMKTDDLGIFVYKHMDHHLRQFGV